jgi:protoheme IX farnesyltransferase
MSVLLRDLLQLTKPTIMLLVLFTGATALVVEGSLLAQPGLFWLFMLGLFLTGGAANALNQYFEREIDARMSRTAKRRPLPLQRLSPAAALFFSVSIGIAGVIILGYFFHLSVAILSAVTILFYSHIYTLWLKPTTSQNIVIGGAAGAMAPIGAWMASTGSISWFSFLMFLIIFLWTPPHFWALAIFCKDDYVKAKLPMLPVVKGDKETRRQMLIYSVLMIASSLACLLVGAGWLFGVAAVGLGGFFLRSVWADWKTQTDASAKRVFWHSIIYLFALFTAMMLDAVVIRPN